MGNRLNTERQEKLEPQRREHAIKELTNLGFVILFQNKVALEFKFKGHIVKYFPYSGWATGKSIKDGRGLNNLLLQVRNRFNNNKTNHMNLDPKDPAETEEEPTPAEVEGTDIPDSEEIEETAVADPEDTE